ncbi:MAG: Ig-like domain-containing protein [Methanobacteriota archaeon]
MKHHISIVPLLTCIVLTTTIIPGIHAVDTSEPWGLATPIFTLSYQGEHISYSYDDLVALETYQGNGGRLKVTGDVVGPFTYTGVRISTLVEELPNPPAEYSIIVISEDGYVTKFSSDQVHGDIMVYDTDGEEVSVGGVIMILAYEEEGISDFDGGPLRISWINADAPITDAFLWIKYMKEIEIIDYSVEDTTAPVVSLEKPTTGLYIVDRRFFPFPRTIILGSITITVDVADEDSGVSQVLFIVDDAMKAKKNIGLMEWEWDEHVFGTHTIKVVSYDYAGNIADVTREVWIFNP